MTDLESRLRDSLAGAAEEAEDSTRLSGLATGARARLRQRRMTIVKVVAGASLAALAPFAVTRLDTDASSRAPAPEIHDAHFIVHDLSPGPSRLAYAMHEVTWREIRFLVPPEWQLGVPTAWCADGKDPAAVEPRIALPGGRTSKRVCTPSSGYGVTVSPAAAFDPPEDSRFVFKYDPGTLDEGAFPDGTWVSYWYDDRWILTIATPDPGLTSRIAMSVRETGVDADSCTVARSEVATRGTLVQPMSVLHCAGA